MGNRTKNQKLEGKNECWDVVGLVKKGPQAFGNFFGLTENSDLNQEKQYAQKNFFDIVNTSIA